MSKILIDEATVKLVLEALKQIDNAMPFPVAKLAQAALREALAEQPAQQEPFAWANKDDICAETAFRWCEIGYHKTPLYTTPQPAQRKPLTEGEFEALHYKAKGYVHTGLMDVVRIVEHHHNIKENT